ncbi:MAG: ABC transporter ATP-binding protein [Proteobacteria bacterium]|nr:ABC transporter ATP-binding protein [Pseudomonadota bacterium]
MSALIDLHDVGKTFAGGKVALEKVSLTLTADQPRFIAVVGESGSGKTTLARLLLGMIAPTTGTVRYQGDDLQRLSAARRRDFRHDVQAVFQDPYEVYNPFYRVDHVLTMPVRKFRLARSRAEGRALIETALRSVGLRPEEILGRYPHQLSGGQRQRIMVARALLLKPKLIVADEPVSMVDASLRATILTSLRRLHEEMGISILYITHDLATAYQVADSIIVLYRAAVAEAGHVERVVKAPLHPYTQLLIGSIPRVSTERDWVGEERPAGRAPSETGCRFADRCPSATEHCLLQTPPLFRVADDHASACFLQRNAPAMTDAQLSSLLA